MPQSTINLVDAITDVVNRTVRARSAVIRIGKVAGAAITTPVPEGAGKLVPVTVGAGTVYAGYHVTYTPVTGDRVTVLHDRDIWVVLGKLA